MRGYGIPQVCFALESHIDDIATKLNIDPIKLRKNNFISLGHIDPLNEIKVRSFELDKCIEKGKELIRWDEKKKIYKEQSSNKRRGLFFRYSSSIPRISGCKSCNESRWFCSIASRCNRDRTR